MSGAKFKLFMRLGQEWGGAGYKQPHVGCEVTRKLFFLQQAGVESGHTHHSSGLWQLGHHRFHIKLGQEDHGTACQEHHVGGNKKTVGVKDGKGMQKHVIPGEAPCFHKTFRIGQKIFMGKHCAFGAACGARGVEKGGEVVKAARLCLEIWFLCFCKLRKRTQPISSKSCEMSACAHCDIMNSGFFAWVAYEYFCRAIAHKIIKFTWGVGGIEWQEDRTRFDAGSI